MGCYMYHVNINIIAVDVAEDMKEKKYECLAPHYDFAPIAIDTMGRFGRTAEKIINKIGRILMDKYDDRSQLLYLRQRIGIAIQKGNYLTFEFALNKLKN